MTWSDTLRRAESVLNRKGDLRGAFGNAFGALETCYRAVAAERGWRPQQGENNRFGVMATWLRDNKVITPDDCELALQISSARNVVLHGDGFEPSQGQVQRTIGDVRRLCSRFGRTVKDAMASPVITASPDQPVGELLRYIIEDGISQFPVVENQTVTGTLTDTSVIQAWERGDGILDLTTEVRELMDDEILPAIDPDATLEEARRLLQESKKPALLVLANGLPVAIVTKYDLLRRLEL